MGLEFLWKNDCKYSNTDPYMGFFMSVTITGVTNGIGKVRRFDQQLILVENRVVPAVRCLRYVEHRPDCRPVFSNISMSFIWVCFHP